MANQLDQYFQLLTEIDQEKQNEIAEAYNNLQHVQDGKWSESQIKMLKCFIQTYCQNQSISQYQVPDQVWNLVARIMNRSVIDCKLRMGTKKKIRLLQQQWQKREDEALKEICFTYQSQEKPYKWSEIARELAVKCNQNETKLAKFVRDRWLNKLNPDIQKGPWGINEEHQLLKFMLKHGKNWANIANEVNHQRTESSLKNRYFNILRKLEKKDVPLLHKQQVIEDLEHLKLEKTDKTEELGQQEISFILYYLKSIQNKMEKVKDEQNNIVNPPTSNYKNGNYSNKKSSTKAQDKDQKLHAKNVLNKVLQSYPQDENIDYSKMRDHFQDVIAQKGDTVELDEEPLSDSNNLSEVQFAIMGKDSQNLHVFPKSQLKAVMDLMKQKKELKNDVQQSMNKISSLPPPLPKVDTKQPQQQSQQPQPPIPVQIPVIQPLMQPVPMPVPIIPVSPQPQSQSQQQPLQQQQQSSQQQQQQQQMQQQQQPMYQIVYPSNFMYPQVQMASVAQIPLMPGQMPQMIGQIPGQIPQMMQAIPGQMPQMMQQIPGQMLQQMPGQMPQMISPGQILQPIQMQNGQLQMPQMAQIGQMPQMPQMGQMAQMGQLPQMAQMQQMQQMAMQQIPIAGQQGPQQFIPILYTPQPMYQQQGQQQQQVKQGQQQQQQPQQMPIMNYQFPMMPAYADPYFQYINQMPQKQPKYSQVKQEQEEQQQQNRK